MIGRMKGVRLKILGARKHITHVGQVIHGFARRIAQGLPRFREEDLALRLGEPLKGLQVPEVVVSQIVATLRNDQQHAVDKVYAERLRLETRLPGTHNRIGTYTDKLDGKMLRIFGSAR
jgi:hypothetical protein